MFTIHEKRLRRKEKAKAHSERTVYPGKTNHKGRFLYGKLISLYVGAFGGCK